MNWVHASPTPSTRVLPRVRRAPVGALALGGGVGDEIPGAGTRVPLERVQEAEPVARLVHGRLAHVVAGDGAAGGGAGGDVAAVNGVGGGLRGVAHVGGEGALAEGAAGHVALEVEVEGGVGALAEGLLHGEVVSWGGAHGPGVVGGEVGALEGEGDAVRVVGGVQGGDLLRDLRGLDDAGGGVRGHDVDVDGDGADARDGAGGGGCVGGGAACVWGRKDAAATVEGGRVQVVQGGD